MANFNETFKGAKVVEDQIGGYAFKNSSMTFKDTEEFAKCSNVSSENHSLTESPSFNSSFPFKRLSLSTIFFFLII